MYSVYYCAKKPTIDGVVDMVTRATARLGQKPDLVLVDETILSWKDVLIDLEVVTGGKMKIAPNTLYFGCKETT